MAHAGGRPVEYRPELVQKVQEYIDNHQEDESYTLVKTEGDKSTTWENKIKVKLPTIEGLATFLGVNKTTVYEWESTYIEFSNVLAELRQLQLRKLLAGGLSGDYNSTIAKLILTKHGYSERTELTGKDGDKLEMGVVILPAKE